MKRYTLINNIGGWLSFLIAAVVYLLTIEPTTSFWDCGEFITAAYKFEVGHPPGAPIFMLMGRFFTLFTGDVAQVAKMVNIMSALASAFTIMFLFWTITHIAKRAILKDRAASPDLGQLIAITGSAFVASMAYTFSDTFWFSAVEGEVYSTSSLFTAVVFWAILKWENVADQKHANRWLILIAYLMGLSIGVHLLNLLAIPAIVLVYYFRKFKPSAGGIILAAISAIVILASIQYGIIPGIVTVASKIELLSVNTLGLPFHTGEITYGILLIVSLVGGIWFTYKENDIWYTVILSSTAIALLGIPFMTGNGFLGILFLAGLVYGFYHLAKHYKSVLNTILVAATVIIIAYSSFAIIVIRSLADPPMDQNNPDNLFSLLSYLNREQYGDRPLLYGQYFNAPVIDYNETTPVYRKNDDLGKYEIIDRKFEYVFDEQFLTFFPRMYSSQNSPPHVRGYKKWSNFEGEPVTLPNGEVRNKPTFVENLRFFFKYQINHMYIRYFMWNFAGRQNDIQGHGEVNHGNWISGIPFIDDARLGPQDELPDELKNNKGRNTFYFLPLIFGLLGMVFLLVYDEKNFWILLLLFFFTGLAIIFYTNQPPYQPRERDYAYAGSFYVFAIYIGLGVLLIYEILQEFIGRPVSAVLATAVSFLLVPLIMGMQTWDDHDRSERYTARDFAHNYLNSCAPNAILFTNGDNDTFPLWYAQEVEGIRTDVRVINLSYLSTDWYIDQMKRKAYKSEPVPFSMSKDKYRQGNRDIVLIEKNNSYMKDEKYEAYKHIFENGYKSLYDAFISVINNSNFPQIASNDYKTLQKGYSVISPSRFHSLVGKLSQQGNIQKFGLDSAKINSIKEGADQMMSRIISKNLPVDKAIEFISSDQRETKTTYGTDLVDFVPSNKFCLPVDSALVLKKGVVSEKDAGKMVKVMEWAFNEQQRLIHKNRLMVLDLMATNNWERPVYFAITVGRDSYMNLDAYFQLEGLAYRVVPIKSESRDGQTGRVASDIMYENMMNKFKWGGIDNPEVYLDENNRRMIMNLKNNFSRLAKQLLEEGKRDSAIQVLDYCTELMPHTRVPYSYYNLLMAEVYYNAEATEKANDVCRILGEKLIDDIDYYLSLGTDADVAGEDQRAIAIFQEVIRIVEMHQQKELSKKLNAKFNQLILKYNIGFEEQREVPQGGGQ